MTANVLPFRVFDWLVTKSLSPLRFFLVLLVTSRILMGEGGGDQGGEGGGHLISVLSRVGSKLALYDIGRSPSSAFSPGSVAS